MSTYIKRIFIVNTTERPWIKIILWWEVRRILFNALLLLLSGLSLFLLSTLPEGGYIQLYAGPAVATIIYLSIILFFLLANVCYTSGWIIQLMIKNTETNIVRKHVPYLFIYGLILTLIISLIPVLMGALNALL